MATSDDRLTISTVGNGGGNPLGLILNELVIMNIILKNIAGISDEDFQMMAAPSPPFQTGITQLTAIINP